jgi:hypothetical protein
MWQLKTQFNKPNKESNSTDLEWSAVFVDTKEEAEDWWECRNKSFSKGSVKTMYAPDGRLVRVKFD